MVSSDLLAGLISALAFSVTVITMALNHVRIRLWINNIIPYFNPYIHVSIPEYSAERFTRSDIFVAIEAYLSDSRADTARKLKAELGNSKEPQLFVADGQQISDTYEGAMFWWHAYTERPMSFNVISFTPGDVERRFFRVVLHRDFRDHIRGYLEHVLKQGREHIANKRERRLFTNNPSRRRLGYGEKTLWGHVAFQHPATFDTLAMDLTKKQDVINDLQAFMEAKEYYTNVGKPWKRGYLLFGPPGTGKSTMIAAMANFLEYDVYDLELTAVKNNTELRKLFIETTGKSIVVIEDIDRSFDFIGKSRDKEARNKSSSETDNRTLQLIDAEEDDGTKLTLSGMLNCIDGLWSACGGERIIILTTNNKDKLDPALIREGRMDKYIEMSYCCYEAFKVLASTYLDINEHQFFERFGKIQRLLEVVNMSPAEVAEKLMGTVNKDADACLKRLVVALEEKAKANTEEVKKSMDKETIESNLIKAQQRKIGRAAEANKDVAC